ncbi:MAG: hypothetical protein KJ709_09365 [Nanoarchaeota archaeon]|nr:hypothetical protein [Nanoarchaeota archaeon]
MVLLATLVVVLFCVLLILMAKMKVRAAEMKRQKRWILLPAMRFFLKPLLVEDKEYMTLYKAYLILLSLEAVLVVILLVS